MEGGIDTDNLDLLKKNLDTCNFEFCYREIAGSYVQALKNDNADILSVFERYLISGRPFMHTIINYLIDNEDLAVFVKFISRNFSGDVITQAIIYANMQNRCDIIDQMLQLDLPNTLLDDIMIHTITMYDHQHQYLLKKLLLHNMEYVDYLRHLPISSVGISLSKNTCKLNKKECDSYSKLIR